MVWTYVTRRRSWRSLQHWSSSKKRRKRIKTSGMSWQAPNFRSSIDHSSLTWSLRIWSELRSKRRRSVMLSHRKSAQGEHQLCLWAQIMMLRSLLMRSIFQQCPLTIAQLIIIHVIHRTAIVLLMQAKTDQCLQQARLIQMLQKRQTTLIRQASRSSRHSGLSQDH